MAVIQVQIGKNTIEDVLLDGGSKINIITEQLKLKLGLPKPKFAPYNLRMAYQTTIKSSGVDQRSKDICSWHSLHNYVYCILKQCGRFQLFHVVGRPWLKDVKVAHDWGNNIVTIRGNGIVRTITETFGR